MTNINIAINGLGRIGKLLLRQLIDRDMNVSLVNEVKGDATINSELIEYDSVHGHWKKNIDVNSFDCPPLCRHDVTNRFLHELTVLPTHKNFI